MPGEPILVLVFHADTEDEYIGLDKDGRLWIGRLKDGADAHGCRTMIWHQILNEWHPAP